jgi:hypothetical protein
MDYPSSSFEGNAMARDAEQLSEAIWSGDFGFICEDRYQDVQFPVRASVQRENFEQDLIDSRRLPELNGAPVASWLLARIARLAGCRFPYAFGEVVGSDGADYWLRFLCMTKPAKPAGVVHCSGKADGLELSVSLIKPSDGEAILDAFTEALLQNAAEVKRCRIVVQYTEMTDPEIAFHIPKVYGWDGGRYLNESAPEHTIDPSDYE